MSQRIVITGLGVFSPVGNGSVEFWQALTAGKVGTGPIQAFDTSKFDYHHGGEVKNFEAAQYFKRLDAAVCDRTTQLAVAAARLASEDAGNVHEAYLPERIGVCMGTTMGNQSIVEAENDRRLSPGMPDLPAVRISHKVETYITAAIAQELALEGPCHVIPTACAAGNYAIGWGSDLIQEGLVDAVIVGGADGISRGCFAVFHRLGAIANEVCQPFDLNRTGMLVGEGAGVLVLENYDKAVARGAPIYAELLGYGLACDAYHPTAPHPEGVGAQASMRRALQEAGVRPEDVSYISAHGTGTHANDASESLAVRNVFDLEARSVPVSSIKSMLGHTMGAASAIEAVACALMIRHGVIPPTANYRESDPDCLQDIVPNQAREYPVHVVLSNSFAFGGNISSIVMQRIEQ
ncbi:MAG TPA: beta-ketoacyl-[acyl-carrier-protein] synthase family protein [Ktedonobacteraceae bacterium]